MKIFVFISVVLIGLIAILGAFPWGVLHENIETRLSKALGRPVSIETVKRKSVWSLTPTVMLRSVHAPQAAWAGDGALADIDTINLRFAALPLLMGSLRIHAVDIDGMTLALARDKNGRNNWDGEAPEQQSEQKRKSNDNSRPSIRTLVIRNATISYDDAVQDRRATGTITSDASGFRIEGDGFIRDKPVRLIASGAPIVKAAHSKRWPFRAEIIGEAVGLTLDGEMETPFSFGRFTAKATAHGDSLALIDAIIEAGLMETQPVQLTGDVERAAPEWIISNLTGTVGRSDLAGQVTVTKGPRTFIDAALVSKKFDFDDLSGDEGLRIAAAKQAKLGKRLFPDTVIELDDVDDTDGRLEFAVNKLLWRGPSPFRSMKGVVEVDHQLLTVRPLEVGLTTGVMNGEIVIDQRDRKTPELGFTLESSDARFVDFFPGAGIDGSLKGHMRLAGVGETIRAAIGRSSGSVALVVENGVIPANTASLLGQDVGRGLTADKDKLAELRCIVARFDVKDGVAKADPVVIDTSRALTKAQGQIELENETLYLSLFGVPKIDSVVRLGGAIPVGGTVKAPDIGKPDKGNSIGEILASIGEAIIGDEDPKAEDADCDALVEVALR